MLTYNPDLKIINSSKINPNKYFLGFGVKEIGDARKISNIFKYFSNVNVGFDELIVLNQFHTVNIEIVEKQIINTQKLRVIETTDGVISKDNNMILTVRTGDCVPIIFIDEKSGIFGISHQGWRGTLKRMALRMIEKMTGEGASRDDIVTLIGPAIGSCCYDIDEDRYYSFMEEFDQYAKTVFYIKHGRRHLSLAHLNYLILLEAGLKTDNIDFLPFCTRCDNKRFFSYRRDKRENYGEMLSFVMKR